MKWPVKPPPKEGDFRHKTRFLFLPMTIEKQVRWLEVATWVEQCFVLRRSYGPEVEWRPISWRDGK